VAHGQPYLIIHDLLYFVPGPLQRGSTMPAISAVTPEEISAYRATARQRLDREQQQTALRRQQAWELARRAAALLKEHFGATRVVVFGSLVYEGGFTRWSDVDIAAWELRLEDTFRAMGAVRALSRDIEINLVDVQTGHPELVETIQKEGVDL
jgi:predicted nucleotidyltransferase